MYQIALFVIPFDLERLSVWDVYVCKMHKRRALPLSLQLALKYKYIKFVASTLSRHS